MKKTKPAMKSFSYIDKNFDECIVLPDIIIIYKCFITSHIDCIKTKSILLIRCCLFSVSTQYFRFLLNIQDETSQHRNRSRMKNACISTTCKTDLDRIIIKYCIILLSCSTWCTYKYFPAQSEDVVVVRLVLFFL